MFCFVFFDAYVHILFFISFYRLGLHLVIRVSVESAGNHFSFMFTIVHYQILTKEVLTASVFKIVLEFTEKAKNQIHVHNRIS